MNRQELMQTVLKHFLKDLSESAKPFTVVNEKIEYMGTLNELLWGNYDYEAPIPEYYYEGNPFDSDEFIETRLLAKYRDKMLPFVKLSLKNYFSNDEFSQYQLFKKLQITDEPFNEEEYREFVIRVHFILKSIKENLYLIPAEKVQENGQELFQLTESSEEQAKQGLKFKNREFTRSRQILLYYFVLKLMGITRLDTYSTRLAEFGHVLFYWPVEVVKNHDLYKKLCNAPLIHKSDTENLKDLEYVKRQFENIDHAQGVALVQKEINSLKRG